MNKRIRDNSGFFLIELLVAISVFIIVVSLTFANYPKFKEEIALKQTIQEITLSIRQAQVYGLGVREFGIGNFPAYGVHFDISQPTSLIIFADINSDNLYDGPGEKVEIIDIKTGDKIKTLCGKDSSTSACSTSTKLNIIYLRPYPTVTLNNDEGGAYDSYDYEARIDIESSRGAKTKTIIVNKAGLISVE